MLGVTAKASSNVALLKYWGRKDEQLRLPSNNSISVSLDKLTSTTTLETSTQDEVIIDGVKQEGEVLQRIIRFLDLAAGSERDKCKVISRNSFPKATGLSSSASGFAALAKAANDFFKLKLKEKELSILARKGSGSACRSIPGGFVRWKTADSDKDSYAETIFKSNYWDLRILAVILNTQAKDVATSEAQRLARTSPYFKARISILSGREKEMLRAIGDKDFENLGFCVEREMFEFQAIPMTSKSSLVYWFPETIEMIHWARKIREKGVPLFCTVNTGHNIYVFTLPGSEKKLVNMVKKLPIVKEVISNRIGEGAKIISK